ncbi:retrovirus-related pol polyprotein from transposon TNT 1-94 [Tanacetum coccineum]
MICRRHGKTPNELLHNKPPDLSYLHVFGALCYPTNDSENLGKLQPKADIGIFICYAPTKKAFWIYNRHTRRIIETIHVEFDELTTMASDHSSLGPTLHDMTPATIIIALIDEIIAPEHVVSTSTPSSTTVDQDAPSPSNFQTTPETSPLVILNDVEENNHDIEVAHMGNDLYFGVPIPEVSLINFHAIGHIPLSILLHDHPIISKHNSKWTKDHLHENIIGKLARPVSTRLQLHEQALFCYYDAFLTVVEPKTLKKALYGLKYAPRAWYDMLSSFLISQDFSKGSMDPTLFIRREGKELLLVQIYVDDIIFAASTPELCDLFAKIMCLIFKMSMMGKIYFLRDYDFSIVPEAYLLPVRICLESLKENTVLDFL